MLNLLCSLKYVINIILFYIHVDGSDSSSGDEIKELEKYKISAAKT